MLILLSDVVDLFIVDVINKLLLVDSFAGFKLRILRCVVLPVRALLVWSVVGEVGIVGCRIGVVDLVVVVD